jgi:hypothetical protein
LAHETLITHGPDFGEHATVMTRFAD